MIPYNVVDMKPELEAEKEVENRLEAGIRMENKMIVKIKKGLTMEIEMGTEIMWLWRSNFNRTRKNTCITAVLFNIRITI